MSVAAGEQPSVRLEVEGATAILTLHRPERRNAFTVAMCLDLLDAFDEIDRDDGIRAVVVTGAGDHFCAGADLARGLLAAPDGDPVARDFLARTGTVAGLPRDVGGVAALRIARCAKPVLAAINGSAVGVGATMTLPMDVRVIGESTRIGFVFVRRGIVPEAASTWFLPRVVGVSRAMEWVTTGRLVGAREAREAGLATHLVDDVDVLATALAIADEIARHTSPVAVAATRRLVWGMLSVAHPWEAHVLETRTIAHLAEAPDFDEGIASFLERRRPDFGSAVSTDLPPFLPPWPADPPEELA